LPAEDQAFNLSINVIGFLILCLILYPLLFVVSASFSSPASVMNGEIWLLPKGLTLEPYRLVFENESIWRGYYNTIIYTAIGTLINIIMTVLAAYPLSRKDLPGYQFIMIIIVFTMFFNGGLIPLYLLVRDLGMANTMWALIIPSAISTYNLIIMRTFFHSTIPNAIQESAFMDGCSNTRLLLNIVLPLSKPILAVMVLFYAVAHWNAYFAALIYLRDRELYPLQLILREILIQNQTNEITIEAGIAEKLLIGESMKYAVIIVSSIPVLVLYPFIQKYFVKGVMIGSIKG